MHSGFVLCCVSTVEAVVRNACTIAVCVRYLKRSLSITRCRVHCSKKNSVLVLASALHALANSRRAARAVEACRPVVPRFGQDTERTRWTIANHTTRRRQSQAAKSLTIISIVRQDHNWCAINIGRLSSIDLYATDATSA